VCCISAFIGQLDASIVQLALPALQRTFKVGVDEVRWVAIAYLLAYAACLPVFSRICEMVGRKLLFLAGFALFGAASLLCGLAPGLGALCAFRAVQALGAAMLQANSLAIIVLVVPGRALGRAIGLQGTAQALGLALGPSVGGLLLAAAGWRLIFLVNVPFGILGAVAAVLLVPRSRDLAARVRFDWAGLALFFPAVVALLSAISFGGQLGWGSPLILALFIGAVALGTVFFLREDLVANPMLDLALFRRARFSLGITSGLGSYLVMFGVLLLVPFYLERALGAGTARSGLELMAMPLAFAVVAPLAGRWADHVGARPLTVGGMAVVAAALFAMGALRPSTPGLVALIAVVGVGLGLFTSPNNAAIMGAAPDDQAGMASGVLNMTRGLGTALGLAVTASVFAGNGGNDHTATLAAHAFSVTSVVLGAVAALTMVVAALRGSGPLADTRLSAVE